MESYASVRTVTFSRSYSLGDLCVGNVISKSKYILFLSLFVNVQIG